MDYEKLYKKALERANEYHFDGAKQCIIDTLEYIFPELKESEDEKIRKGLIDFVKSRIAGFPECKRFTDWLEKQGQTFTKKDVDDAYLKGVCDTKREIEKQGSEPNWCHHKVDLSNCSEEYRKGYYDGWNNCNMQHSQCESEKSDVLKCLINGMKFYYEDNEEATWGTEKFSMKVKDILSWLEKQGEQKHFDYENANIQQKDFSPQKDIPRYSIGDVLCDKSCTTLNKESQSNFEITDIRNGMYICDKCSFPISQQDEYELVAKRIKQKPADLEEFISELSKQFPDVSFAKLSRIAVRVAKWAKPTDEEMKELLRTEYEKGRADAIAEMQKPADSHCSDCTNAKGCVNCSDGDMKETGKPCWSEEDEQHIDSLLKRLDGLCRNEFERTRFAISEDEDWLKSLKDRVQPNQEWSEVDKKHIGDIMDYLNDYYSFAKDEYEDVADGVLNEIRWLQSIQERL